MIKYAVRQWNNNEKLLENALREMQNAEKLPTDYEELVKWLFLNGLKYQNQNSKN